MSAIPTRRHLEYATGFIGLGMFADAERELKAVAEADRSSPAVLTIWIDLHMHAKQWKNVIEVSRQMVRQDPTDDKGWISWAFALRELNRFEEARDLLLKAMPLHGKTCDVLHYNLACYECLLGNLPEAKRHLKTAVRKDKQWKTEGMDDPDLEALWPEIKRMGD